MEENSDFIPLSNSLTKYSFNKHQNEVLEKVLKGKSIFYTGAAGTGKSHLLNAIRIIFGKSGIKHAFIGPTGISACNIGGVTIHSWAGIGFGEDSKEILYSKVRKNGQARKRWKEIQILFIDEVSMLSKTLFDKLSYIGCKIRNNDDVPFGGIQLVLSGDFFQLPPIAVGTVGFLFESDIFKKMFNKSNIIILDHIFRQKEDSFLNILNEIRVGNVSDDSDRILRNHEVTYNKIITKTAQEEKKGDITQMVTKIFPLKKDAETVNTMKLAEIQEEEFKYQAIDSGEERYIDLLDKGRSPKIVRLKKGALVLLTINWDQQLGLVNGSKGIVKNFVELANEGVLPVVEFEVFKGGSKREKLEVTIKRHDFAIESQGRTVASRKQLPLMLAWAMTVHKCQGMTLVHLEIAFRRMFEYGQVYVALSRAIALDTVHLVGYDRKYVKASSQVLEFYNTFNGGDDKSSQSDIQIERSLNELQALSKILKDNYANENQLTRNINTWISRDDNLYKQQGQDFDDEAEDFMMDYVPYKNSQEYNNNNNQSKTKQKKTKTNYATSTVQDIMMRHRSKNRPLSYQNSLPTTATTVTTIVNAPADKDKNTDMITSLKRAREICSGNGIIESIRKKWMDKLAKHDQS